MNIARLSGTLAASTFLWLSACQPPAQLRVEQAYIKLSPLPDRPSSGYFTIYGGPDPVSLRSVVAPAALRVEMHETATENGMATMQPVKSVTVAPREKVIFEPGGKHIMVWGIDETARKTGEITLQFSFSNGDKILVTAPLRAMGTADGGHH